MLLFTVIRNNRKMMRINYVLDFPHATVKRNCYMMITKCIEVHIDTE